MIDNEKVEELLQAVVWVLIIILCIVIAYGLGVTA